MKKVILAIIFAIIVHLSFSQSIVFHENFESPSMGDSVISSGTPSWFINTSLYSDGSRSFRDTLNLTDTTYLTTNSFSTLGSNVVSLSFDHICKLEHFDNAEIEVSVDNGVSWIKLTASHYQGNGQFGQIGNRFTATSYSLCDATNNSLAPTNSWLNT